MQSGKSRETVLEQVRRCLALSESSNEHEAAIALEMAHALLLKYNLDISEVQTKDDDVSAVEEASGIDVGPKTWKMTLWFEIAKANFCTGYVTSKGRGKGNHGRTLHIIGRHDNIMATMEMGNWITEKLDQLADLSVYNDRPSYIHGNRWRMSYLGGATATIYRRLREMKSKDNENTETRALVVLLDKEADDYMQSAHGKMRQTKVARASVLGEAWTKGATDAKDVSLTRTKNVCGESGLLR